MCRRGVAGARHRVVPTYARKKMDLALITAKQVFELFLMVLAGVVLFKLKIVSGENKAVLTSLLIKLVIPCLIVNSFMGSSSEDGEIQLGSAFVFSIVLCALGVGVSILTSFIVKKNFRAVFRFGCGFSNAAYMGFPLIRAMFGHTGIIYASAYVTVFNIMLWTVGYTFFAEASSPKDLLKSIVKCPPIVAVFIGIILYVFKISLPQVIVEPVGQVGAMTTPLAMIVTGITIAETNILASLKSKEVWFGTAVRLVLIPLLCTLVFAVLKMKSQTSLICLILEACPVAAITPILAVTYGKDEKYASALVVVSTVLSIVTLPLYVLLLQMLGF